MRSFMSAILTVWLERIRVFDSNLVRNSAASSTALAQQIIPTALQIVVVVTVQCLCDDVAQLTRMKRLKGVKLGSTLSELVCPILGPPLVRL